MPWIIALGLLQVTQWYPNNIVYSCSAAAAAESACSGRSGGEHMPSRRTLVPDACIPSVADASAAGGAGVGSCVRTGASGREAQGKSGITGGGDRVRPPPAVRLDIDAAGQVSSVKVVSAPLGYGIEEACVAAWKRSTWKPAMQDGVAVAITGMPQTCVVVQNP